MPRIPSRRRFLQAGAPIGMLSVGDCHGLESNGRTDGGQTNGNVSGETDGETAGAGAVALRADYVVWKDDETIEVVNGRTLETEFNGTAGDDDATFFRSRWRNSKDARGVAGCSSNRGSTNSKTAPRHVRGDGIGVERCAREMPSWWRGTTCSYHRSGSAGRTVNLCQLGESDRDFHS